MVIFPDLEHYKGDTFDEILFEYKINGIAEDLTNTVIKMQLRKEHDGAVFLSLTSVDNAGITITDAVNGLWKINRQVIDIKGYNYIYDIEFNKNGEINTDIKGNFNIINDVTHG